MSEKSDSDAPRPRGRVTPGVKAAAVETLLGGGRLQEVAAAYGLTVQALRKARKRDALFDAGWRAAYAASAAAERWGEAQARPDGTRERWAPSTAFGGHEQVRTSPGRSQPCRGHGVPAHPRPGEEQRGQERVVSNNRRLLQRRKLRHVRFDEGRRALFLARFAGHCDLLAAAREAGVSESTVYNHVRRDPVFAAEFQAALKRGYAGLEAEAVQQGLAAQARLRSAVAGFEAGTAPFPAAESAEAFGSAMKLLARWDRKDGPPGMRTNRPSASRAWTFEQAIVLLDKKLRALGLRTAPPPPDAGGAEGSAR